MNKPTCKCTSQPQGCCPTTAAQSVSASVQATDLGSEADTASHEFADQVVLHTGNNQQTAARRRSDLWESSAATKQSSTLAKALLTVNHVEPETTDSKSEAVFESGTEQHTIQRQGPAAYQKTLNSNANLMVGNPQQAIRLVLSWSTGRVCCERIAKHIAYQQQ